MSHDLILYAETPKSFNIGPCTHDISAFDTRFYLPTEHAKKYNNCLFCAIQAWGYMTHTEIAKCLGTTRINVCLIEKRAVKKIRKALGFSCRVVDECLVEVYGIVDAVQRHAVAEITRVIARDIGVTRPVVLRFDPNRITLFGSEGIALYEDKKDYHKITFNTPELRSVKEFVETILHEISHAAQIESKKLLSNPTSEAIAQQFSKTYREKYRKILEEVSEQKMVGIKAVKFRMKLSKKNQISVSVMKKSGPTNR